MWLHGALFALSAAAAPKGDLIVQSIEGMPSSFYGGDPVVPLTVVVKNIGATDAPPMAVTLSCEPMPKTTAHCPSAVSLGWGSVTQSLAPGETRALPQWPNTSPSAWVEGKYRITATVDANNQVGESNESNNTKELIVIAQRPVFEAYLTPKNYTVKCPVGGLLVMDGYIKAIHGGGIVKWQLINSFNNPANPNKIYEATLKPGETQSVSMSTATDQGVSGWVKVHFVSPTVKDSAPANFSVNCLTNYKLKKEMLQVVPLNK